MCGRPYRQANHLGVTIQADIIKQKLPELQRRLYRAEYWGTPLMAKSTSASYSELTSEHPIDLTRYQVANCYMGRAGIDQLGGASGEKIWLRPFTTAVINKRAGGMDLFAAKAFQRPMAEGVKLLNGIQDVTFAKR
jgi:class I fructose-bisphosphate aldolase